MDGQETKVNNEMTQNGQADKTTPQTVSSTASQGKNETPANAGTFTQKDIDDAVNKAKSQFGRAEAEFNRKIKDIEFRESKLSEWEKTKEAAELEEAKGNPEKLNVLQERKSLRQLKAELETEKQQLLAEKAQHSERLSKVERWEREQEITSIAKEVNGDAATLMAKADEFGISGSDKIKALAKTLWPVTTTQTKNPNPANVFNGKTNGGGGDLKGLSARQLLKMGVEQKIK